jgi:cysteinyl-tRNA synthetase
MPQATQHIPEMAAIIARLLENGHAYRTDDGSIFFRIASWPAYGALARLEPEQLHQGERVAADDYSKDDVRDFAVWKGPRPGEPNWPTQIGDGRPGWHIECSAMSMKYLGESFDIHTGGVDLIFPHHENEIAQSEAATGQKFVNTWLHCAHLQLGGQKMARREGNIYRPAELYEQGWRPAELRYALLATHYRAPLEWGDETMPNARAAVERLTTAVSRAADYDAPGVADDPTFDEAIARAVGGFRAGLDDDLNVALALAAVFELVRDLNRRLDARSVSTAQASRAADTLRDFDTVLAVIDEGPSELPGGAQKMLDRRAAARAARDWATSDRLRDELAAMGVAVEDTAAGQRWRRIAEVEHA